MKAVMQQALDAFEGLFGGAGGVAVWRLGGSYAPREAMAALREAIAAPGPAPIGYAYAPDGNFEACVIRTNPFHGETALYLATPDTEALRKELERVNSDLTLSGRICRKLSEEALVLTAERDAMALDAGRYRDLRRGQKWSVVDGIGDTLRGDDLDAAIDAAMATKGFEP